MAEYRHGIYSQELDTALIPMTQIGNPIVAVGTAPIHIAKTPAQANTPVLCYTLAEFVEQFGWSDDFGQFTLCEVAYTCFQLYNVAPVVFINILGTDKHLGGVKSQVVSSTASPYTLAIQTATNHVWATSGETAKYTVALTGWTIGGALPEGFIKSSKAAITMAVAGSGDKQVWLGSNDYTIYYGVADETGTAIENGSLDDWSDSTENEDGEVAATTRCWRVRLTETGAAKMASGATKQIVLGTATKLGTKDITVGHDADGNITVTLLRTTNITGNSLTLWYQELSRSSVKNSEVIGGYDAASGSNTGLECIEEIYPRFGLIPGTLIVPYWSQAASIALIMKAKTELINGCFKGMAAADISTYNAPMYSSVNEYKNGNNLLGGHLITCWPRVALGERTFFMSTHVAALMAKTDAAHDDLPYKSPSNEQLMCDRSVLNSSTEYILTRTQANYLNGIGVVTALNFNGWRLWGNRTSAYPSSTDPKDAFISVRRMMNFIVNTLVTSFWSRIDEPINKRLVETVMTSAQIWLNGLVARGALVGGTIQFLEDENPVTDLSDGIIRFHLSVCPPSPARVIEFVMEYQPSYYSNLFA